MANSEAGRWPAAQRILVALDVPTSDEAVSLVRALSRSVGGFKVGLELFHAEGPGIFARLRDAGAERILYDGKFNDIPNTVARAVRAVAQHGLWLLNVHTMAGRATLEAARTAAEEGARANGLPRPRVLGVTVLTSLDAAALRDEVGIPGQVQDIVVRLARLAQSAGLDGVIASPLEAAAVRAACGRGFMIVTPGVRAAARHDQRRVATPRDTLRAGADYLVIGREITGAGDPSAAAAAIARAAESGEPDADA